MEAVCTRLMCEMFFKNNNERNYENVRNSFKVNNKSPTAFKRCQRRI